MSRIGKSMPRRGGLTRPARRDWHSNNFEGHAPTAAPWGASGRWVPACTDGCIDPQADGVLAHAERADAVAQASHILAGRIHGPADTETPR